ncbi:NAD(P)H-binding domain-containing protein [Hirsutella rhossiliensis]|uniref:NAD(P)H-binding domain-containing protein n=1 Tax=Hirsutella rhossiliensis TaxID=111463 RepID=A0A9P8MSS1_9HYPO|nr:NAD(P)H-binding domain-containing protein [Hirsutella rhossiliensis]KAH0960752.1 NAD(P)H-binding domain-containing protein [Hirsutella rhossiliensis]
MHIYVSGGSGRNGRLAIDAALQNGHSVTALVRDHASLRAHPRLTVLQGSPTAQPNVEAALRTPLPPAAIITALNPRRTSENPFSPLAPDSPPDLLARTARVLLAALDRVSPSHRRQQPKIVVNSSLGVGASWHAMAWPTRLLFRYSTMRLTLRDHDDMDLLVRRSGRPFVLARPARLVDGVARHVKALPDDGSGCGWNPTITRSSVAGWLVTAAESSQWDGKSPVLVN